MIKTLKRKFIATAAVSAFILMTVLVLIMNIVNYCGVVSESNSVLDVLSQPGAPFLNESPPPEPKEAFDFIPPGMSPEVPYESRFFAVTVSADGEVLQSDLSRIISVDEESAQDYINRALGSGKERGFIGDFRYSKTTAAQGTRILFLDCGRTLASFRSFLWISVAVGLFGFVVMLLAFIFASGRILAPVAESHEKQKRFISDAGHEIKTPLTIINANVDLLRLDGEKEELTEILQQTERLTRLTNNLVMLSKMEEAEHTLVKVETPLSDLISETANSFRAPAAQRGLDYSTAIEPGITADCSPDAVRHLTGVLLENAVKYSPKGGKLKVSLAAQKKNAVLTVFNTTEEKIDEAALPNVFDRFYRTDSSRNSQTGGHGIGLSIAKAVAEAHGGTIAAKTQSGNDFTVTVTLPL
ncbi:MAG: HAMP domain-containing histidine kinase [Clostridia bacterium]|nr:HAMP domain-containing histidine kinase [Clostridia bacterium]